MNARPFLAWLGAGVITAASAADASKVAIVAYIQQASGCQRHTEVFLQELAVQHGERVTLEFVDFGSPAGRRRWLDDGLHCMAIRLNGTTQARIVHKGVELAVVFEMPAGHRWLHEELAVAVRQLLHGVAPEDRQGPTIAVGAAGAAAALTVDGRPVWDGLGHAEAGRIAAALRAAAAERPIIQDDFTLTQTGDGARILLRDGLLAEVAAAAGESVETTLRHAAERCAALAAPFPRVSRPFPGMETPKPRRLGP